MNSIGIDLGGTNVKGVLLNEHGEILLQKSLTGQALWKDSVKEMFFSMKAAAGEHFVAGIAAPGLPDEKNEKIIYMPGRLDGLVDFEWSDFLGQELIVINDAHAALEAEAKLGVAKGLRNVVMLTLGTGVGGAILIDGKLYQGKFQRAGSLGDISLHADSNEIGLTGMPGSLEDAIGNDTVFRRSGGRFRTTHELVDAANAGDKHAHEVWMASVKKLAVGICSLINVLSPEAVVIGGGIAQSGDALFKPLANFMDQYEMRPLGNATPILRAQFSEYAGAVGAACFAFSGLNDKNINT